MSESPLVADARLPRSVQTLPSRDGDASLRPACDSITVMLQMNIEELHGKNSVKFRVHIGDKVYEFFTRAGAESWISEHSPNAKVEKRAST